MLVLLSIRPVHVANILSGAKKFEFRRKLFARCDIRTVLIYCTMPVGRLVGEFDIVNVLQDRPERLWRKTKQASGISKEYFDEYFSGRTQAFAIQIGEVRAFERHVHPDQFFANFTPPQSFMYVNAKLRELLTS
jgi:predicted transcriptional regulator